MARQQKPAITDVSVTETPKKSLFDRVAGYLDAQDWQYKANQENGYFTMNCRIKDAGVRVFLDVDEAEDWCRVLAYSTYPIYVPELRRAQVADALTRINYSIIYGNLEMDLKDGEVRVRTVVEGENQLSDAMIDRVLNSNLSSANRYFATLMAVAFGNAAPDTVLDLVERQERATLQ
jgi:hypothetical protein